MILSSDGDQRRILFNLGFGRGPGWNGPLVTLFYIYFNFVPLMHWRLGRPVAAGKARWRWGKT